MSNPELIIRNVLEAYGEGDAFSDACTIHFEWTGWDDIWQSFAAAVRAARCDIVEEAEYVLNDEEGASEHSLRYSRNVLDMVALEEAILALPQSEIIAAHRAGVAAFMEIMVDDPIRFYDSRYSKESAVRACREASRQYIDNALEARGGAV